MTSTVASSARARTASTSPRSASTGGLMPRTSERSSSSAVADVARRSARSALAAAGSVSTSCSAAPIDIPMATRRAWAPSCRPRSMRSSSAACVWVRSARMASSCSTRFPSRERGTGPRNRFATGPKIRHANGAPARPAAIRAMPYPTRPGAKAMYTPQARASSGRAATGSTVTPATTAHSPSQCNCGSRNRACTLARRRASRSDLWYS